LVSKIELIFSSAIINK